MDEEREEFLDEEDEPDEPEITEPCCGTCRFCHLDYEDMFGDKHYYCDFCESDEYGHEVPYDFYCALMEPRTREHYKFYGDPDYYD